MKKLITKLSVIFTLLGKMIVFGYILLYIILAYIGINCREKIEILILNDITNCEHTL